MGPEHPISWLTVLICATGVFIAILLARTEWHRYTEPSARERPYVSRGRLARRLTGAILMVVLMAMLLIGVHGIDFRDHPILLVVYWGIFVTLVIVLGALGVLDLIDTRRIAARQSAEDLQRELRAHFSERDKKTAPRREKNGSGA